MMQKHKFLAFGVALLCALLLWFYAVTVVNPDDTKTINNVKVRFDGTDVLTARGLMLVGGEELRVNIKVRGRRSDLKELNKDTVTAVANLSRVTEEGEATLSWTLECPPTVASGDIAIEERSAATVTVPVAQLRELSDMEIQVRFEVTAAKNYWTDVSQLSLGSKSVTVRGPAEEIDRIENAVVVISAEEALMKKIDEEFPIQFVDAGGNALSLSEYCSVSTNSVHVTLPIYHAKTVNLAFRILDGVGATAEDVLFGSELPQIVITGSRERLAKLADTLYIGDLDLSTFNGGQLTVPGTDELSKLLPDGLTIRTEFEEFDILASLPEIISRKYEITPDQIVRLDTRKDLGFAGDLVISVTLRGRAEMLEKLSAEDVTVTVNMDDYDPETMTVKIAISLPEGNTAGVREAPQFIAVVELDKKKP